MGPIRNPSWSTSGMRVTLSYIYPCMSEISYYYHLHLIQMYICSQYPTLDLSAFRESGYNPSSPKIAILVADL